MRIGGEWKALGSTALRRARQLAQLALHGSSIPALTALGAALGRRRGARVRVQWTRRPTPSWSGWPPRCGTRRCASGTTPGRVPRRAAPLPARRAGLAGAHARAGPGRAAGRRHGTGQDRPADRLPARPARSGGGAGADRLPDVGARELEPRAPPVRSRPVGRHPSRPRPHAPNIEQLDGYDVVLTSYSLLPRDRRLLGEATWRAVVLDEAQQVKNPLTRGGPVGPGDAARGTGSPSPARRSRTGWTSCGRSSTSSTPACWTRAHRFAGCCATPDRAARRRARRRARCAASPPPFILRRRKTDPDDPARPAAAAGVERVLHADGRAGRALPSHDRRHAERRPRIRRDRAPRPRAGAAHAPQAGVQPPGARARPAGPAVRPLRQARPAGPRCWPRRWTRATARWSSPSTP